LIERMSAAVNIEGFRQAEATQEAEE